MSVIVYRLTQSGQALVILSERVLFGTSNVKVNIKKKPLQKFNLHTIVRLPCSVLFPEPPSPPIHFVA